MRRAVWVLLALSWWMGSGARAEDKPAKEKTQEESEETEETTEQEKEETGETDFHEMPARKIEPNWTEYDLKYLTFKWGIFALIDWGGAWQSEESAALVEVDREWKIRDFRFTFSGKFATEREITYTMGLMYDGPTNTWFPRETGIQFGVTELWSYIFVGRQKEGISLSKITPGYAVPTMERMPISDASIPILADGIKWLGVLPSLLANWNVAFFYNQLPKSPSHDVFDTAFVARFALVPLHPDKEGALLHLGVAYHWGKFSDDEARLKSRPESSTAPFFVDTGVFPAEHNNMLGLEAYFRKGNWLVGAEYLLNFIDGPQVDDPLVHGGEAYVSWVAFGGEQRPYVDLGGKLGFVSVNDSAFSGGKGALEAVLHFSYTDLDDGDISGGTFWRLTPQLNWYIDDMVSLRVNYGLAHLDRFGVGEITQFYQARLQFQIQ